MRRLRYNVAMSLDGYIATEDGGYDWITMDPAIDFAALYAQFDCYIMGRKTYETMRAMGDDDPTRGQRILVVSTTLDPRDYPDVEIVRDGIVERVRALKVESGRDIWIFGGGTLFATLLDAGIVDTVEVAIIPILLGGGIPLLPGAHEHTTLALVRHDVLPSGIAMLTYDVSTSERHRDPLQPS